MSLLARTRLNWLTTQATLPEWIAILSLIFGGCCSNVFSLEAIIQYVAIILFKLTSVKRRAKHGYGSHSARSLI
jgi:hypothetical protein